MKKKKKEDSSNKYPNQDSVEMRRLWKVAHMTEGDVSSLYRMFKLYVNPNAPAPMNNCNCIFSPSSYYDQLRDWFSLNSNKFE